MKCQNILTPSFGKSPGRLHFWKVPNNRTVLKPKENNSCLIEQLDFKIFESEFNIKC